MSPTPLAAYPDTQISRVARTWDQVHRHIRPFALHVAQHIAIWSEIEIIQGKIVTAVIGTGERLFMEIWAEDIRNSHTRNRVMERAMKVRRPMDAELMSKAWRTLVEPTGTMRDIYAHSLWAVAHHPKLRHRLVLVRQNDEHRREAQTREELRALVEEAKRNGMFGQGVGMMSIPYDPNTTQAYTLREVNGALRQAHVALMDASLIESLANYRDEHEPMRHQLRSVLEIRLSRHQGRSGSGAQAMRQRSRGATPPRQP